MKDIDEVAELVLLQYICHFGQSIPDRLKALNAAMEAAEIEAVFEQKDDGLYAEVPNEAENDRAAKLRSAIESINRGECNDEIRQIARVIRLAKEESDTPTKSNQVSH